MLYGENSKFQSKRQELLKTTKTILIDKTSPQPQISDDTTVDIRCNFQTLIDFTLKAQSTIILPRADAVDIISFLQQCDPKLIAALVVD